MAGYWVEILEQLSPRYRCSKCRLVLKDPYQTYCGHRYCETCLEDIYNLPETILYYGCTGDDDCKMELSRDKTFPDMGARRDMWPVRVLCMNDWCNWVGRFRDFEIHIQQCQKNCNDHKQQKALTRMNHVVMMRIPKSEYVHY
ncbi:TNF receptor-associated factor 2-like isoform X1 [Ptychodera flava]|uniref:TNF receptor-associated factor 2-like isoform X1 n=1 Tax=Ptychodera flava TaxID=63121 RepID=UPI00396A3B21